MHMARGTTVRDCARALNVPYTEVAVEQFDDPYQVPRMLQALLEAPLLAAPAGAVQVVAPRVSLVEKVMRTPLLGADGRTVAP
jgi:hypothetical protein